MLHKKLVMCSFILSICAIGCAASLIVTSPAEQIHEESEVKQEAKYRSSDFSIQQIDKSISKDDDPLDFIIVKYSDQELEITFDENTQSSTFTCEDYTVSISCSSASVDSDKQTLPVNFKLQVKDIDTGITTGYVKQLKFTLEKDIKSSKEISSSNKSTSSSKSDTSKVSSNTGNASVAKQSSATSQTSNNTVQSSNTQSEQSQPVHVHEWKEHHTTSTRTIQTGTIHHDAVTTEHPGYWWCACGATFASEAEVLSHQEAEIDQGQLFNYGYKSGYTEVMQNAYDEPVYSDETYDYVDYYYCSCGATK